MNQLNKIDPNLESIALADIGLIKQGKTKKVLFFARDYLSFINFQKPKQIDEELKQFENYIKGFINNDRREQQQ